MDVSGVDFDAEEFRSGIRTAMGLGMPVDPDQRPVFVRLVAAESDPAVDADGLPWDVDEAAVEPTEELVTDILCALEWPPGTQETVQQWGPLQPGQLRITLLDEEYAQVEGFALVRIWPAAGGEAVEFLYRKVLGRYALGSVEVWTVLVASEDVV